MNIDADQIVALLNEIHRLDPTVLPKLIEYRVPCNKDLAYHRTVQVGRAESVQRYDSHQWLVGMLGIINGLVGVKPDTTGYIAADYNDNSELIGFSVLKDLSNAEH